MRTEQRKPDPMRNNPAPKSRRPGPYMMAMVLGTALTTLNPSSAGATPVADISPHAVADLSRYCTACWRNARLPADAWNDCTQEVLCRLLQRVPPQSWPRVLGEEGDERREFVRAIDAVKKRTQRRRKFTPHALDLCPDGKEVRRQGLSEERTAVRQAARELLTDRQQRILQLSFEGWSVQDIGKELKLGPERVSDEKYKAIRKLRTHLADRA